MSIPAEMMRAAMRCVELNIPFAVCETPEGDVRLHASLDADPDTALYPERVTGDSFLVRPFIQLSDVFPLTPSPSMVIPRVSDPEEILRLATLPESEMRPGALKGALNGSTRFFLYKHQADDIIRKLKQNRSKADGLKKCVLSRRIAVTSKKSLEAITRDYWEMPGTFRALWFTPDTGLWITATPELRLRVSDSTGRWETMALAGTMAVNRRSKWSDKDKNEHSIVVEHLQQEMEHYIKRLDDRKTQVETDATTVLETGAVKHLCTPIWFKTARGGGHAAEAALKAGAYPTPAVAGLPVLDAIATIYTSEIHERLCYGGNVGIYTRSRNGMGRTDLYANLRCMTLSRENSGDWLANIFVGGGLMPDSDTALEWHETEIKATPMIKALEPEGYDPEFAI